MFQPILLYMCVCVCVCLFRITTPLRNIGAYYRPAMRLKYTQFMYISQFHLNYNTGSIDRVDERRTWFKKLKHYYLRRTLVYNYPILLINTLFTR